MNKRWQMMGVMVLALAFVAGAQETQPAKQEVGGTTPGSGGRSAFGGGSGQGRGAAVEQWLQGMKQKSPAEYDRLRQLRKDNPSAFRQELRERLVGGAAGNRFRDHPKFQQFLAQLPAEEREQLLKKFGGGGHGEGGRHGALSANPELQQTEKTFKETIARYRAATDETSRKPLRDDLRKTLEQLFDQRQKLREASVERIERELVNLKKDLGDRKGRRQELIDQHLQEILQTPAPASH